MYTSAPTPQVVDVTPSPSGDETKIGDSSIDACNLMIDKQPIEVFYKDEGGKANHLLATVHLSEAAAEVVFNSSSSPTSEPPSPAATTTTVPSTDGTILAAVAPLAPAVHLTATLYYESGIRVEDGDEIFTVLSFERSMLKNGSAKAELRFRVEKVSRRKDGQRFKVRFDVDKSKSPALASGIQGTFTSCVCVLSKRKFSAGSSADTNPKKGRRGSISIGHSAGGFSYVGGGSGKSVGGRSRQGSMGSVSSAGPTTSPSGNTHGSGASTAGVLMVNPSYASTAEVQKLASRLSRFERVNDSLSQTVRAQDDRIAVLERVLQSTLETQTKLAHQLRQQQQQQQQQQQRQQPMVQMQRFSNQQNQLQNLQQHSMHSAGTANNMQQQHQHSSSNSLSSSSSHQQGGYLFNNNYNSNNNNRENAARFLNGDGTAVVVSLGFDDLEHNSAVSVKAENMPSSSLSSSPAPHLDDDQHDNHHNQEGEHMIVNSLPRRYGGQLLPKRQRSLELLFNFGQPCSSPPLDFGDVVGGDEDVNQEDDEGTLILN